MEINNKQISAEEYCELSKLYLKKLAELESKKMEELELHAEMYGQNALALYTSEKKTDEGEKIESRLRTMFKAEHDELREIISKMLNFYEHVTVEEIKES